MSSSLLINDERILRLTNAAFDRFNKNLLTIAKQHNIKDSSPSMKLMDVMSYGAFFEDIVEYFGNKQDIQEFIKLVTLAIQKAYDEGDYSVTAKRIEKTQSEYPAATKEEVIKYLTEIYNGNYQNMLNFRNELINYAKTLKLKELEENDHKLNK